MKGIRLVHLMVELTAVLLVYNLVVLMDMWTVDYSASLKVEKTGL